MVLRCEKTVAYGVKKKHTLFRDVCEAARRRMEDSIKLLLHSPGLAKPKLPLCKPVSLSTFASVTHGVVWSFTQTSQALLVMRTRPFPASVRPFDKILKLLLSSNWHHAGLMR